tara:strand:+ start:369 stop:728 length:360 start_codon:yes stop_codon:yes gene_type:complete
MLREIMKNLILALVALTLLSNCGAPIAMMGTASTSAATAASGNLSRSAFTSAVSVGMKKTTGSLPAEHIMNEFKKEFNKNAKDKVEIINQKKDKLKNQVVEVKENIIINSRIKFLNVNP